MTTAAEIRARAWAALKAGGWWPMMGGCALIAFMASVLAGLAFGVLVVASGGSAVPADPNPRELLKLMCALSPWTVPLSAAALYFFAVTRFSQAAMGLAAMRGGVRVAHALSGFGKGWSTLCLMAAVHFVVGVMLLLLVIPGIFSALSYSQSYFVKVDHPDWSALRCMNESRRLMDGSRWRYLRLLLSFLGLFIISALPLPGMGFFFVLFVLPYFLTAQAAFYEDLLDKDEGAVLTDAQAATLRRALEAKPTSDPTDFTDPANPR